MLFEFLHNESVCTAFIPDKNIQPVNTLTVYILDHNADLGYQIIFLQHDEKKWETVSAISKNHPFTYRNMCDKLGGLLKDNVF